MVLCVEGLSLISPPSQICYRDLKKSRTPMLLVSELGKGMVEPLVARARERCLGGY